MHKPYGPYERYFKRPLDLLCSLAFLLVFWWLYGILALLIRVKLGKPVLFTQERPGRNEKIFKLYKFRSMTDQRDENGVLLPDEARLTRFGRTLRSTSLDELPELFNIIRGDMSIVGPRPLLVQYLPYYSKEQRHRHDVRPGLTGPAQIHGRNALQWEKRFQYDIEYVNRINFITDVNILLRTVKKVFLKEGIVVRGTSESVKDFDVYRREQRGLEE